MWGYIPTHGCLFSSLVPFSRALESLLTQMWGNIKMLALDTYWGVLHYQETGALVENTPAYANYHVEKQFWVVTFFRRTWLYRAQLTTRGNLALAEWFTGFFSLSHLTSCCIYWEYFPNKSPALNPCVRVLLGSGPKLRHRPLLFLAAFIRHISMNMCVTMLSCMLYVHRKEWSQKGKVNFICSLQPGRYSSSKNNYQPFQVPEKWSRPKTENPKLFWQQTEHGRPNTSNGNFEA